MSDRSDRSDRSLRKARRTGRCEVEVSNCETDRIHGLVCWRSNRGRTAEESSSASQQPFLSLKYSTQQCRASEQSNQKSRFSHKLQRARPGSERGKRCSPCLSPLPTAGCVGASCTTASPFGWKLRHCSTPAWPKASDSTAQWKSWRTMQPGKSLLDRRGCCWGSGDMPLRVQSRKDTRRKNS